MAKGETGLAKDDDRSGCGVGDTVSAFCAKFGGFMGIFGFSALLTGGGTDELFAFPLIGLGLNRPSLAGNGGVLGDRRLKRCSRGIKDPEMGVVGRGDNLGGIGGMDSRARSGGLWESLVPVTLFRVSSYLRSPFERGGDRGEFIVRVGAGCGDGGGKTAESGLSLRAAEDPRRRKPSPLA